MKPLVVVFAASALSLIQGPPSLRAEGKRLAFIVGVDSYEALGPSAQLSVAVSDAKRMKSTLETVDPPFLVRLVTDGRVRDVEAAFDTFLDEAKGAECALVYFAGHGVEYYGANFLLVKDTDISDISPDVERMKRRLATEAISLQGWVDSLDATKAQVKVVILDCCRDNPLRADAGGGTRSVVGASRGLAQVTPPSGTLISYSADAGQRANDGLFTEVLAKNLREPGLNIVKVFAKTREEVRETSTVWASEDETRGLSPDSRRSRHEPAEYNKLNLAGTDFTFTRGKSGPSIVAEVEQGSATDKARIAELEKRLAEAGKGAKTENPSSTPPTETPAAPSPSMIQRLVGWATTAEEGAKKEPTPAAKTDPMKPAAFPASRSMEGSRAGEVREFGGIQMVWCPPGTFLMGSPETETERSSGERQHRVTLTKGFWLAKTECTQAQWDAVTEDGLPRSPHVTKGSDLPEGARGWDEIEWWLSDINRKHPLPSGWKWKLPTEAQWEYACRAGAETAYSFGDNASQLSRYANFADRNWILEEYRDDTQDDGVVEAAKVASYEPNPWGLHDMHGNVSEWCADYYGSYTNDVQTDPTGAASHFTRVVRGGNWKETPNDCRSASRWQEREDTGGGYEVGFRPAIVPPDQ